MVHYFDAVLAAWLVTFLPAIFYDFWLTYNKYNKCDTNQFYYIIIKTVYFLWIQVLNVAATLHYSRASSPFQTNSVTSYESNDFLITMRYFFNFPGLR